MLPRHRLRVAPRPLRYDLRLRNRLPHPKSPVARMRQMTLPLICLPSWLALRETMATRTVLKRERANRVMETDLAVVAVAVAEAATDDRTKSLTTWTEKAALNRMSLKTKSRLASPVTMRHPTTQNRKRSVKLNRKRAVTTKGGAAVRAADDDGDAAVQRKNRVTPFRSEWKAVLLARRMPTTKRMETRSGQRLIQSSLKKNRWHQ